jgi:hypothetical protein
VSSSGRFSFSGRTLLHGVSEWVPHKHNITTVKAFWGLNEENMRKREPMEDINIDGRIILKWTFKKWEGWYGLDWFGSG